MFNLRRRSRKAGGMDLSGEARTRAFRVQDLKVNDRSRVP